MGVLSPTETAGWADLAVVAIVVGASTLIAWRVAAYITSPLRKFPGPLIAGWTNLYRLRLALSGDYHLKVKELHDKYGPVVRLGPDILDLDYPQLVKTLYGTDNKYVKTDFYHNNSTVIQGHIVYNMFSQTNVDEHHRMKRPIAKHYSPGAVLTVESLLDKVIGKFCDNLESRFIDGPDGPQPFDLGAWIAYCTWDMVGAASFSQDFGYMAQGCDHDGTIEIADKALDYFAVVGQIPFLDSLLDKNPIKRIGPPNLSNITRVALEHIAARTEGKDLNYDPSTPDYLQRFIEAKETHPDVVHDGMIMNYLFINLIAGSDTTALTIRAVVYFLLKNPGAHSKLRNEILEAGIDEVPQWNQARALPYLEAVIRESMRLHPGVSMMLERYVPEDGLKLPEGSFVPSGTRVGINPYIINRNESIFGDAPYTFRPERWLQEDGESDEAYQERLKLFNNTDLTFGGGSRICLGRHLAMLEVYKIVATLVGQYDIELDPSGREWEVRNGWFLRQRGLICKLKRRE